MMELPQIDDYHNLFINDIPLIDVRAPVEFNQGAFPAATNLPLMEDDERHRVGIRYKELGQTKAIELGHELVNGRKKENRIDQWVKFAQNHPTGALYCFRGGLRSKISQQWLYETTGVLYPRVSGGYKALRHFLMDELEKASSLIKPVILGGRTGSGKTPFLQQLEHQIDLEGIFNHRGSAFGKHAIPQPSQIDIENTLSVTLLKYLGSNVTRLVMEDEASNIGSRRIPTCLMQTIQQSPVVVLEVDLDERIDNIYREYIIESLAEYQNIYSASLGFETWASSLLTALNNIQRRLGGVRHQELKNVMKHAIHLHSTRGEQEHHKEWIRILLTGYYDPMYNYQLSQKTDRVVFSGEGEAVLDYLRRQENIK